MGRFGSERFADSVAQRSSVFNRAVRRHQRPATGNGTGLRSAVLSTRADAILNKIKVGPLVMASNGSIPIRPT